MEQFIIEISLERVAALEKVAAKDGLTIDELIQKQVNYYCSSVIDDFINNNEDLTEPERETLRLENALKKAEILNARKTV